jgi:hypothetical protein
VSFLRRRHDESTEEPARLVVEASAAARDRAVRERLATTYRDGLRDGILETLDQLEGRSKTHQGDAPEPTPELRDWIATVRARIDQEQAESSGR